MMLREIAIKDITEYRKNKWRLDPKLLIKTEKEAIRFIDDVGMCLLFLCTDIPLPKLSQSAKSENWDWWEWKDTLQAKKKWYNSRVIKKKSTIISMKLLPAFLAVYYDDGGCEVYEEEYFYGKLTEPAFRIADYLYHHGPTSIDDLRKTLAVPGKSGTKKFHNSLQELQSKFKIAVSGRIDKHWGMRVIDLFSHWAPQGILQSAESINIDEARQMIIESFLHASGIASIREIKSLFGWSEKSVVRCMESLLEQKKVHPIKIKYKKGKFIGIV